MSNELQKLSENKSDLSMLSKDNFEHSFRIANMLSKSEMVPKAYFNKPQNVLIAMEMGRQLNLSPLQAIQNIAVINGRPCLYGDGILAVCSGRPDFENITETPIVKDNKTIGFSCAIKRKERAEVVRTFTIEDATLAQLWGKPGPWKQYPERMLQMRARGFAIRDSFADALQGFKVAEEVQDYEVKDITPISEAKDEIKFILAKNVQNSDSFLEETAE